MPTNNSIADKVLREEKLRDIQLKDSAVLSHMHNISQVPTAEINRISKAVSEPFNANRPGKLKLNTSGGIYSDYLEDLRNNYNKNVTDDEEEIIGEMIVGDAITRYMDIEVRRAVVALLETGRCFDSQLALAVDSLFRNFLEYVIEHKEHLTSRKFIEIFKATDPYEKNLVKELKSILNYE